MSTLDTKKITFTYIIVSIFTSIFGAIYECFSHGVYSNYMIYAFLFPLIGGALLFSQLRILPNKLSLNLYNSGIATLTVGSIMKGVLNIYGTSNSLINVYFVVGIILICISSIFYILNRKKAD